MSTERESPQREEEGPPPWPCDERALRWLRDRRNQDEYDDREDREREEDGGLPPCPPVR